MDDVVIEFNEPLIFTRGLLDSPPLVVDFAVTFEEAVQTCDEELKVLWGH